MSKILTINVETWVTQAEYARLKNVSSQVVSNWIARGKLETWLIPELGLRLVKRK
jgi:DNA-binding transcriptional regulator YiaG